MKLTNINITYDIIVDALKVIAPNSALAIDGVLLVLLKELSNEHESPLTMYNWSKTTKLIFNETKFQYISFASAAHIEPKILIQ